MGEGGGLANAEVAEGMEAAAATGGESLLLGEDWETSGSVSEEDECSPRIGEEYQVDIPPFVTRDFLGLKLMDDDEEIFAVGSPVRISFMHMLSDRKQEVSDRKQETAGTSAAEQGLDDEGDGAEDHDYTASRNGAEHPKVSRQHRKGKKKKRGGWSSWRRLRARNSCETVVVPGDSFEDWSEDEIAAFTLGLYLFGKNFVELKRFVGSRTSADLQHYYYSRFYGSVPYKRWFAARNNNSRRIVNGQQILIGWRQEEFVRRLLPELDESSRSQLYNTIASFNKGDIMFHSFVNGIKDVVGLELLIEAVALGCGKRDLTMGSPDSAQSSKKWELPVGKAFSDFTALEMSRALSGGYRLSKSKAQDLFWEAIWPRLLAKGWSSEQASSKGQLVYMVPGIKRYSKRSLVKGRDYFDSISEVLNYLSSNPTLLEHAELDSELISKDQSSGGDGELGKKAGDSKHRWLSKRTSHSSKSAVMETGGGTDAADPSSNGREMVQADTNSTTKDQRQEAAAFLIGSSSSVEGHELVTTSKRSFYDAFSEGHFVRQAGLAAVGMPKRWLSNMIMQYLGNGKSMRLYGPMVATKSFQVTPCLFLSLDSGGKPAVELSWKKALHTKSLGLESSLAAVTTTATASPSYCRLELVESRASVEEIPVVAAASEAEDTTRCFAKLCSSCCEAAGSELCLLRSCKLHSECSSDRDSSRRDDEATG